MYMQLQECEDELELRRNLDSPEYDFRFSCGVTQALSAITIADKDNVISSLCRHFAIYSTLAESNNFEEDPDTEF